MTWWLVCLVHRAVIASQTSVALNIRQMDVPDIDGRLQSNHLTLYISRR